jgi:phosphatidylglycerophosphate synthase
MNPKPGFEQFWSSRGEGYETAVNRWATSHAAAVVAYASARLGLTPNQVTLMSFICGVAGFLLALGLPAERPAISIVVIVIFAEVTFILDCADGLLARVTNRATPCGSLLDHTLDIASQSCALGAIFVFAYRAGVSLQNPELANAALVTGFFFLVARATRHAAIHLMGPLLGLPTTTQRSKSRTFNKLLTNLLEYQASMIAAVAYLLSPLACLVMFGAQALMCAAAVTRRLVRAVNLEQA